MPHLPHRQPCDPSRRRSPALAGLRRGLARLRAFHATQVELHERLLLLNRPWEEEFAHWSYDGHRWHLHGHLPPPPDGRRRSVTPHGWCPASRC
ncbi:hypothetical protein [Gandjariella thermophila]|uniref:Uncharacterized protein n=1 Tax=Gandjariella thermophila TaxID=1931992 RepID=A0A4D4J6C3_9PSEU|nr:hypothetical protein [Gandjariella thermophila]GDY30288.1 hypothetical protein GTS_19210 [Gandjariella thermophila]